MGDKSRLCNVCGHWVPEDQDIVTMAGGMGPAHLVCAAQTAHSPIREELEDIFRADDLVGTG